ncbi:ATP-binding cassette domain-containing protein [Pseudoalteromonas sp. APC 3691]|uniref:ATP-binding cassette domain-containing protein n=1 Tax=Pseudoalteromonas sp. APC 3691 TaxID=3035173 RepID=UPI0025B4FBD2|nr:ATP-binding cassette domain-containing protein [Pseudoalteromonas sp. APC 3691]MDN3389583.1 ATP-binding cassette domain-containing protein [Pseudoalteromonas sp. APC 3691]
MKSLKKHIRNRARWTFFFSFVTSVLMLVVPIYSLQVFDRVLSSFSLDTLYLLTIIAGWLVLVYGCLEWAKQRLLHATANEWREQAINLYAETGFKKSENGKLINDIKLTETGLQNHLGTVADIPWTSIFLFVLLIIHPTFFYIAISSIFILMIFAWINYLYSQRVSSQVLASDMQTSILVNKNYLVASGFISSMVSIWKKYTQQSSSTQINYKIKTLNISSLSKTYRLLVQIAVTCVGVSYVLNQALSVGGMIAASLIIGRALAPFEQSVLQLQHWVTCYKAWKRVTSYNIDNEIKTEPAIPNGSLIANKVIHKYSNLNKVFIKAFSANFTSSHVILGANGSGKTTLLKILADEYQPFSGDIRIEGSLLSSWDSISKQKIIGIYRSDLPLAKTTIISNMAVGESQAYAMELAQELGLHKNIMQHTNGYDTELVNVETQLSSSEIQLIILIKALSNKPHILIADNIDDHLDTRAELALAKILAKRTEEGKITIYSAKKMNLISKAQNIIYLEEGSIQFNGKATEFFSTRNKMKEASNG